MKVVQEVDSVRQGGQRLMRGRREDQTRKAGLVGSVLASCPHGYYFCRVYQTTSL